MRTVRDHEGEDDAVDGHDPSDEDLVQPKAELVEVHDWAEEGRRVGRERGGMGSEKSGTGKRYAQRCEATINQRMSKFFQWG